VAGLGAGAKPAHTPRVRGCPAKGSWARAAVFTSGEGCRLGASPDSIPKPMTVKWIPTNTIQAGKLPVSPCLGEGS